MKIGIDASRANNLQKTGVEWYAFYLLQELKKIIPENMEVILYSAEPLQGELAVLPKNWQQKILKWPPKRLWTQMRLSLEMIFHKPDILFIPAHVFPIIHPKKTVMTIHDIAALDFGESYNFFEKWYSLFSGKLALKKLWKIIVPSIFTKQELKKLSGQNFPEEKIKVIYHGFNQNYNKNFSLEEKNTVLNKYKIGTKFLLSISRLEHKKNTLSIVKAFEILKNKLAYSDLQLVLIGKPGYGFEEVQKIVNNSPYKKDIILPGWVEEKDLPVILSASQIFVFPSLYEGFGLPILQAMSAGIPVVTSKGSSLSEIGGEACLYIDPNNVSEIAENIAKFLLDENLRQEKINLGLLRAKDFSWEKCAKETWDVLFE
ncbi:MAG: hypothetical protein AUJ23_01025 [Candidatus Magasanikbacteria bacterium CG1_02_32_51]|uniref:Glycosyl transferase family 1 domain-containing protein n=1 Tax=Candidatus Magasanikbacteria bacterium CG1_02_32_51 TaxID=1805238 RepID=A0A1J4UBS6_9BACT|nr:MAG: hypothetical protein AUJ23_01025 [Candidatus Magasanikbacteria bacterium CG1_02_32_51]